MSQVFPIEMADGTGYVLTKEIASILPHQRKKDWSVLFTDAFPDGVDIKGAPDELAAKWEAYLLVADMSADEVEALCEDS